jgi:magnesium/cobalt transport protein CorA
MVADFEAGKQALADGEYEIAIDYLHPVYNSNRENQEVATVLAQTYNEWGLVMLKDKPAALDATREAFDKFNLGEEVAPEASEIKETLVKHRKASEAMLTGLANIEVLEEEVVRVPNKRTLAKLNSLRKELIIVKRNVTPVREMVNGFIKSESDLIDESMNKYFKDVYDHIVQASDIVENYRDILASLQDLYMSQVNLKMNEVMKVMAIVTCLLAPGTVIGGIFGMNFDVIPIAHQRWGFYLAVGVMLFIPMIMLIFFKRRGWF